MNSFRIQPRHAARFQNAQPYARRAGQTEMGAADRYRSAGSSRDLHARLRCRRKTRACARQRDGREKTGPAACARGEREPARYVERVETGVDRAFGDDGADALATQGVLHRPQRLARPLGAHDQEPRGIDARLQEARSIGRARFAHEKILDYQRHAGPSPLVRENCGEPERESERGKHVRRRGRHDLVKIAGKARGREQGVERRPLSGGGKTADRRRRLRASAAFDAGDLAAQKSHAFRTAARRHRANPFVLCLFYIPAAADGSQVWVSTQPSHNKSE